MSIPFRTPCSSSRGRPFAQLDYHSFFELFGQGWSRYARQMYHEALRATAVARRARAYWDRHIAFFRRSWLAQVLLLPRHLGAAGQAGSAQRPGAAAAAQADRATARRPRRSTSSARSTTVEIRHRIWTPWLQWFLSRSLTLSLVGRALAAARPDYQPVSGRHRQFIRDALEAVLLELPFKNNYFWRVYLQGHYTPDCCPEYLKKENFDRLKTLLPRLHIHTSTVTDFLRETEPGMSQFVLLDHMDWMGFNHPQGLVDEWNAILDKARPNARAIFRSAGLKVDYLDHLQVQHRGQPTELGPLLRYHPETEHQAAQDRPGAHLRLLSRSPTCLAEGENASS